MDSTLATEPWRYEYITSSQTYSVQGVQIQPGVSDGILLCKKKKFGPSLPTDSMQLNSIHILYLFALGLMMMIMMMNSSGIFDIASLKDDFYFRIYMKCKSNRCKSHLIELIMLILSEKSHHFSPESTSTKSESGHIPGAPSILVAVAVLTITAIGVIGWYRQNSKSSVAWTWNRLSSERTSSDRASRRLHNASQYLALEDSETQTVDDNHTNAYGTIAQSI